MPPKAPAAQRVSGLQRPASAASTIPKAELKEKDILEFKKKQFSINDQKLATNMVLLKKLRTFGSLNAGLATGLLGFDGFSGTIIYFILFFIVSYLVLLKTNFKPLQYFLSFSDAAVGGILGDLLVFILVWVISQNLVHIL